jgi:hypothetical protein
MGNAALVRNARENKLTYDDPPFPNPCLGAMLKFKIERFLLLKQETKQIPEICQIIESYIEEHIDTMKERFVYWRDISYTRPIASFACDPQFEYWRIYFPLLVRFDYGIESTTLLPHNEAGIGPNTWGPPLGFGDDFRMFKLITAFSIGSSPFRMLQICVRFNVLYLAIHFFPKSKIEWSLESFVRHLFTLPRTDPDNVPCDAPFFNENFRHVPFDDIPSRRDMFWFGIRVLTDDFRLLDHIQWKSVDNTLKLFDYRTGILQELWQRKRVNPPVNHSVKRKRDV